MLAHVFAAPAPSPTPIKVPSSIVTLLPVPSASTSATVADMPTWVHVEVADAAGAADDASVRAEFGERPWEEKWSKVTRLLAEIEAIYTNRGSIDVAREAVEDFFKAARELADGIKAKTGKNAVEFVNKDADMAIPDGFAQTLKHHTRTKAGSISVRIASIDTALPGIRVEIAWSRSGGPETNVDALDLARMTVAAWRRYFAQEGLTPPA